jgi:Short C-terminal domain
MRTSRAHRAGTGAYDQAVGLFGFLRRKDEDAIPKPGTPEFEAAVQGSAIPDSQSVSMGETGWSTTAPDQNVTIGPSQTVDLRGTGKRAEVEKILREHGIDPNQQGQTIDASSVPGLKEDLVKALFGTMPVPNAGGFGGGISPPKQDPLAVVERLAEKRDAGEITDAEFEAQKRKLLGS